MNILFLHGLESKLSPLKKTILEKYGSVYAPDMDYFTNPNMIQWLNDEYQTKAIEVIIGSSMGGFAGYYLAKTIPCPALLFNPALPYRTTIQNIPEVNTAHQYPLTFVLGAKDTIINASDNLLFVAQNPLNKTNYTIHVRHDLEHQIPIPVFEEEVKNFFTRL